jgi:Phage integrase family
VRQEDGSFRLKQKAKKLGTIADYPLESQIMPLKTEFMHRLNAGKFTPEAGMVLTEFVEKVYLPYIEELRESTKKGYREIWNNHICERVGHIRLREFRTVDASKMLKAIAEDNDLSRTTLQHIKSMLSGVFTHAKNEGAFDGVNPVQDARIPRNAREPGETYAYNLTQIRCILGSFAAIAQSGCRDGVLCWTPEGRIARARMARLQGSHSRRYPVHLGNLYEWSQDPCECKTCTGHSATGRNSEHVSDLYGEPADWRDVPFRGWQSMDLDKLAQRVIRPLVKSIGLDWYGWHGFRRGIASNLYELGADEKVVQRILRHAKPHVTKERYIKAFDPAVLAAMRKLETSLDAIGQSAPRVHQIQ